MTTLPLLLGIHLEVVTVVDYSQQLLKAAI